MSKRGARTPGYWYDNTPIPLPARMLAPVYGAVTAVRRSLYRRGWLKRHGVPVPVVVIGNVTAGGTGKTPLTITLVSRLQQAGWTPGVASRGYGRDDAGTARWVDADTPVALGGDEPVLIAWKTGARVRVDTDRLPRRVPWSRPAATSSCATTGCSITGWHAMSKSKSSTASAVMATDACCPPGHCANPQRVRASAISAW